jgi:hypothetical protein
MAVYFTSCSSFITWSMYCYCDACICVSGYYYGLAKIIYKLYLDTMAIH